MYSPILQTDRLIIRALTLADVEEYFLINKDWEVVKYTGNPPMKDTDEAREVLINVVFPQYETYNMGRLAVIRKDNGKMIGWCGLKYEERRGGVDLGYRYLQSEWGKGYGTEAAKCLLNHGFKDLNLPYIYAWADIRNGASYRIMEKIGMHFVGNEEEEGESLVKYQAINPLMT